jgi:hypothetical protein
MSPSDPTSVPASPSFSAAPGVIKAVRDGMLQDVVDPLKQVMRALDPDAGLPRNALGEIGADAIQRYYEPFYRDECKQLQQGWRTAQDIAEAVRACANTYTSYEMNMVDYVQQAGAQLRNVAMQASSPSYKDAEDDTARLWTDAAPRAMSNNPGPLAGDTLDPSKGLSAQYVINLDNASSNGPYLESWLTNFGARLQEIANQSLPQAASTGFSEVGQTLWKTAIFDAPALFSALTARHYARNIMGQIFEGALPGIKEALFGAWNGQSSETAHPIIEKFASAVRSAEKRAESILDAFQLIIDRYCNVSNGLKQHLSGIADYWNISVNGDSVPSPSLTSDQLRTISNDVSVPVENAVNEIRQFTTRSFESLPGVPDSPFPVLTSPLPDAHTWDPARVGRVRAI